jgi:hypothetical protein
MDDESKEIFKNPIEIDKIRSDIRTGLNRHLHRHTINLVTNRHFQICMDVTRIRYENR